MSAAAAAAVEASKVVEAILQRVNSLNEEFSILDSQRRELEWRGREIRQEIGEWQELCPHPGSKSDYEDEGGAMKLRHYCTTCGKQVPGR